MTVYYIYLLRCFGKPVYVGSTIHPKRRFQEHKRKFGSFGLEMIILEEVDQSKYTSYCFYKQVEQNYMNSFGTLDYGWNKMVAYPFEYYKVSPRPQYMG